MQYKKPLPHYLVRADIFNEILRMTSKHIQIEPNIHEWYCGYCGKMSKLIILYNNIDTLIISQLDLHIIIPNFPKAEHWMQYVIKRSDDIKTEFERDVTGLQAYNIIHKMLLNVYTEEGIVEQLNSHVADYDYSLKQYHYYDIEDKDFETIYEHPDAYYYDINGAHCDALCEIFPKAKQNLIALYKERKTKPENKKYINYFVGYLKLKGYERTYNWIVQRTTKKLMEAIKYTGGLLVYANTDGFIVYKTKKILPTSKELGDFKLEYHGTVYTYGTNIQSGYYLVQYQKDDGALKTIGSALCSIRDKINLAEGKIVHYDRIYHNHYYIVRNLVEEKV